MLFIIFFQGSGVVPTADLRTFDVAVTAVNGPIIVTRAS